MLNWKSKYIYIFIVGLIFYILWLSSQHSRITMNSLPDNKSNLRNDSFDRDFLGAGDFSTLIDLKDFKFTINQKPCDNSSNGTPHILILIPSAPHNIRKRNVIRETWGQQHFHIRTIFLLGAVHQKILQDELELENDRYGDIIQGNFMDVYRNLTYKHVMAFKWFCYYCPQAQYVLKADDDVFVNTPLMYYVLNGTEKSDFLFCIEWQNAKIHRSYRSKFYVKYTENRKPKFPAYCQGASIIYSRDVIFRLYKKSQHTPFFWVEDVYATGMARKDTAIPITDAGHYFLERETIEDVILESAKLKMKPNFIFTIPNLDEADIRMLWAIAIK